MILLLSTQSLLDILSNHNNIVDWFRRVEMRQVEISAVSVGQATETIQRITNPVTRKEAERQLEKILTTVRSNQGIIPFDEKAARIWADLESQTLSYKMPDGTMTELSHASRMVVATAIAHGATLVEGAQPYHNQIQSLSVVSP